MRRGRKVGIAILALWPGVTTADPITPVSDGRIVAANIDPPPTNQTIQKRDHMFAAVTAEGSSASATLDSKISTSGEMRGHGTVSVNPQSAGFQLLDGTAAVNSFWAVPSPQSYLFSAVIQMPSLFICNYCGWSRPSRVVAASSSSSTLTRRHG